jgi:hypothetical protein
MANLNSQDRLNLKNLIKESDCEDNTNSIRELKHSVLIRNDIRKLENLKKVNSDLLSLQELAKMECSFLYNNYMDIFNKILKNEIDLQIMSKFLIVLKMIEDGKVDQHEGSAMVGQILKELYLDSAVKCADNLDKAAAADASSGETVAKVDGQQISWNEYKKMSNK